MPIADYKIYCKMLDSALINGYAYPAINVSSIETANAALEGFAEAKSDGIIQISIGGGKHASGQYINDTVLGAISLASHIHLVAEHYNVFIALHTDHCQSKDLNSFVLPLIQETENRRASGLPNLFQSHMFDGGQLTLDQNIELCKGLASKCAKNDIILEVEAGVVGGEEDGINNDGIPREKLFTTPQDMLKFYEALNGITKGKFMLAATFGNVHGSYKPGKVKLKPSILYDGQQELKRQYGSDSKFYLVFHGGSGSTKEEIHESVGYGVVKMNVDTDAQYAFTRPIVDHIMKNYDGVLKIDGEIGAKKQYDPRSYLKAGEIGMKMRVIEACNDLNSAGKSLFRRTQK